MYRLIAYRGFESPSLRQNLAENPVKSMICGVFCFSTHEPTIKHCFFDSLRASQRFFARPSCTRFPQYGASSR
ncbi:hypothetical protein BCEN4_700021 [Burkholderia cenocepacia]|nr:hypothetical protein BCEN4_700021 [Burkholderia cenocepacia]